MTPLKLNPQLLQLQTQFQSQTLLSLAHRGGPALQSLSLPDPTHLFDSVTKLGQAILDALSAGNSMKLASGDRVPTLSQSWWKTAALLQKQSPACSDPAHLLTVLCRMAAHTAYINLANR